MPKEKRTRRENEGEEDQRRERKGIINGNEKGNGEREVTRSGTMRAAVWKPGRPGWPALSPRLPAASLVCMHCAPGTSMLPHIKGSRNRGIEPGWAFGPSVGLRAFGPSTGRGARLAGRVGSLAGQSGHRQLSGGVGIFLTQPRRVHLAATGCLYHSGALFYISSHFPDL